MPVLDLFKSTFDELARNGYIGDVQGELAYGYLRVSSKDQADEGSSGLPRQIQHVHESAMKARLKIPWELLYADDDSGFEFINREGLSLLRNEYKDPNRRAHAVVVEHLDRLSRNADWHQGFLLDEMRRYGVRPIFWKEFGSRIERAVLGAIAQDGMEQAKQRMADGNIHKARDGRVTARTPAYGYKLVDSMGRTGDSAKRDSHYAVDETEAVAVRFIYDHAIQGVPLRRIAVMLQDRFPPPKKMSNWEPKLVALMIKNSVYKGEFIAHRWREVKVSKASSPISLTDAVGKMVTKKVERPPEEWITVPVPPIVSAEQWELANKMLKKNHQMGRRNAREPFLLTGLLKCATCGYTYIGGQSVTRKRGKEFIRRCYRCSARSHRTPHMIREIGCIQSQITCHALDDAVWSIVYNTLLDPQILIGALESEFNGERNAQLMSQVQYLENQIRESEAADAKLYKAYMADVFDEHEYAERRRALKENSQRLIFELEKIKGGMMTQQQFDERKQSIISIAQSITRSKLPFDAPFEVKQRLLKTVVDKITLNVKEGWFYVEGVISGEYLLSMSDNSEQDVGESGGAPDIDSSSKGRDSWLRSA